MLRVLLRAEGIEIGRQRGATLMRRMGVEAIYRRPNTSKPAPGHGHKIYPYLLRSVSIGRLNQVWATDITYIPMAPWWWSSPSASRGALRVSRLSARAADDGKKKLDEAAFAYSVQERGGSRHNKALRGRQQSFA